MERGRSCPSSVQVSNTKTVDLVEVRGHVSCLCSSRSLEQAEVAAGLASVPPALLHRPQLLDTSLGELVHAVLHLLHPVDRCLLLRHGLDGERCFTLGVLQLRRRKEERKISFFIHSIEER